MASALRPLTRLGSNVLRRTLVLSSRPSPLIRAAAPRHQELRRSSSSISNGSSNSKRLRVTMDNKLVTFDHLFLRDACKCPRCVHPSTQQKLFRTVDIPESIFPKTSEFLPNGTLRITWNNDIPGIPAEGEEPHVSEYSPERLKTYSSLRSRIRARYNDQSQVIWDKRVMERDVQWMEYKDYMKSDRALFGALRALSTHGLVFVRGIPDDSDAVEGLAERIGNLKDTFYGRTWDVKSVKESKNIA